MTDTLCTGVTLHSYNSLAFDFNPDKDLSELLTERLCNRFYDTWEFPGYKI